MREIHVHIFIPRYIHIPCEGVKAAKLETATRLKTKHKTTEIDNVLKNQKVTRQEHGCALHVCKRL